MHVIRSFTYKDWKAVRSIYAQGIKTKIATFETTVPEWEDWDKKYMNTCRIVAEINDQVVGFGVLSLVSQREVYKGVAEVSIYVDEQFRGKDIGRSLLENLIVASENNGFWSLQAGIFPENEASIELHKKCGFRQVGIKEKIGKRDGKWHDNHVFERRSKIIGT